MAWVGLGAAALVASSWAVAASAETAWPGLRGPNHDGSVNSPLVSGDSVALEVGWKVALGSGYSSVVVRDGRVLTMFADGDSDYLGAYDAKSGAELWRYRIGDTYVGHDGSHDGPISTPWVDEKRVYGLGPYGELFAVDAATGKEVWAGHLVKDHGGEKPHYGFTSSPVVVGDVMAVQIGGEGKSLAGFNVDNGEMLWSLGDDAINYQSPIVFDFNGELQIVSAGAATMIGVDPKSGNVLWSYDHGGDESAMGGSSLVPIPAGKNRIFLANKVDSSAMVQVSRSGSEYSLEELWANNTIKSSYVIPVVHDDHLYGISGRILTCVDAATGERKWRSRDPGDGFPTLVGDHLVIITKPGSLHVVKASPESYQELAELPLFDEHSWSAVAAVDGGLYARSMGHLARIDVNAGAGSAADSQANWIADTRFGAFLDRVAKADDKKAVVDSFLAEQSSFPVIEPSGAVHFLYRGEAEDVGIVGDMIGFRREDPMTRLAGTDLFYYSTLLEPNAAVTYGFLPNFGDPVADPMNDQAGAGLFGEVSWFAMPAYERATFLAEAEASKQGRLDTVEWESAAYEGKKRQVKVYLPAGYDSGDQRYPVIYFPGGQEALEQGESQAALDNLIGDAVAPVIGVFLMPSEEPERRRGPDPGFAKMLTEELIPKIDADYRTIDNRMARAVVGSGRAAQLALMTAFGHSDLFGKVASQSATMMDPTGLAEMMPAASEKPMVIYQEWGTYHLRSPHEAWDMAESSRKLWSIFRDKGYRPTGGEVPEGFGWQCWKGRTDDLLAALFPNRG